MSTPGMAAAPPKKDDVYYAGLNRVTVLRVAKNGAWADILVEQLDTHARWTKRQPLPFPADWVAHEGGTA